MTDVAILSSQTKAVPQDYTIPGAQELLPKSVKADMDGTAAAVTWFPCLQILDPGGHVMCSAVASSGIVAGASADVNWFPHLGGGGGSSGSFNKSLQVALDTPDSSANAFPVLTTRQGFTNVRRVLPSFLNGVDGSWSGSMIVPSDYASGAALTLYLVANAAAGNVKTNVGTSAVAPGSSEDPAYTTEATVTTNVPGSANQLFVVSFTLTTVPVADDVLNVKVTRTGSADTCAAILQCVSCRFHYA